jgi:hypothetical protein
MDLARQTDQFQSKDITFWGVFALAVWAVAVLSANISALIPVGILGGLHASRLDNANLSQIRAEMVNLQSEAAQLKSDNAQLLQRFALTEQTTGEVTRRVGALELSVPKLVEGMNSPGSVDRGTVTASTGTNAPVTTFDTDGGSVSYTTSPLSGTARPSRQEQQPMPKALGNDAQPDASAFGIALGPPIDENEGDTAWQSMNAKVGTLLIGLAPILAHVEGGGGRRLVAGPLASEADARELCGRMAKVGIACASVAFIGDPLPLLN